MLLEAETYGQAEACTMTLMSARFPMPHIFPRNNYRRHHMGLGSPPAEAGSKPASQKASPPPVLLSRHREV